MMDNEIDDPDDAEHGDQRPDDRGSEGVRIIGATEAGQPRPAADDGSTGDEDATDLVPPREPLPEIRLPHTMSNEDRAPVDLTSDEEVDPSEDYELPHYSEPPTGQVPRVVIGEETDASWSGMSDQPRWRDTDHQFEEQTSFTDLVNEDSDLGVRESAATATEFFDANDDLTDDGAEPTPVPRGGTGEVDDAEPGAVRRPPAPRRRPSSSGERIARGASSGADGGRNVPLAAAVGVGLVALGAVCFSLGSLSTAILVAVVLCVCAVEFFDSLRTAGYRPASLLGIVAVASLAIAPLYDPLLAYPVILGLVTITGLAWFLFVQPGEGAVMNLGVTLLGIFYIGGFGSFATLLLGLARPFEGDSLPNQGIGVVIAAVLVTVAYDVGAFFIGRALGHTPLSEASPNKTQEGLYGGIFAAILLPTLIIGVSGLHPVGESWTSAFAFCLICALMAPVGDLCESALKRDLGVKDMGHLLPGHGGVLDRFDGMLFVLPTAFFMAHLLGLGSLGLTF